MKSNYKKGFTLIELLGVISVLAIIMVSGVLSMTTTLKNNQIAEEEEFLSNMSLAAEMYIIANKDNYPNLNTPGNTFEISVDTLINHNYVSDSQVNPETEEVINTTDYITAVVNSDGILEYSYTVAN
ncbi:MAG: type II secretion system protein [Mycoplasmatota bacterium]